MTDAELEILCREAMGYTIGAALFHPLTNDEHAMALLKRFQLSIAEPRAGCGWGVYRHNALRRETADDADLNRAIVMCVVKLHLSSKGRE